MKTLNKILCSLLVVVMCLTSAPLQGFVNMDWQSWCIKANADDQESYQNYNGFLYMKSDKYSVMVVGYEGNRSTIEVPREINGMKVGKFTTERGGRINNTVKKIIIPDTVEIFDLSSDSVEELYLPNSIVTILGIQCKNLKKLIIPDSVISLGTISSEKLKVLEIPEQVESIGFIDCKNLKKLNIPSKITKIYSFRGCISLTDISFEGEIESVPNGAFYECVSLKKVDFKKGVKHIEEMAFIYCISLEEIQLPEGIERIEERAFSSCSSLKTINIPKSVTSIGESAFEMCLSLENINISDNVTNIEKNAFSGCISMKEAVICSKTVKIDEKAFYNNFKIKNLEEYLDLSYKVSKKTIDIQKKFNEYLLLNYNSMTEKEIEQYYAKLLEESGVMKLSEKANALMQKSDNKLLIRCYKGSTAEKYAKENGIKYKYFSNTPDEVTGFKASTITGSAITLSWDKDSDATGYIVYKYDSAKKKNVKLGSTKKNTYKVSDLKKGTTYKFKIKAYKKVNDKTYYSDTVALTTATKPGTPTLKATAGTKSAKLTWNKQTGATGYMIYMATSKDGKYSKIATVKGNSNVSYTKKSLTTGKTYYFKVRAYKTVESTNIYGSYSSIKSVKAK